jgi:Leucine-rich repeat (LRR) protein
MPHDPNHEDGPLPPASTPAPFARLWHALRTLEALLDEDNTAYATGPVRALLAGAARLDRPNIYGDAWYVWVDPRTAREWAFCVGSESPSRIPDVMFPLAVLDRIWPSAESDMDYEVWTPERIASLSAELFPTSSPDELQGEAELAHRMWRRAGWVLQVLRGKPPGELQAPELRSSYDEERAFQHFARTPGCAVFWALVLWLLEGSERLGDIAAVCTEPLVQDLIEALRQLETGTRETLGKVALRDYREPLRQLLAEARAGREALRGVRSLETGSAWEPLAQGLADLSRLRSIYDVGGFDISPDIARLKELEELISTSSTFMSLRAELFQLPRLRRLHLLGRGMHSVGPLPEALGNLEQLEELLLWRCGVTRVPGSIGRLQALRWLVVTGGTLDTLPPEFARLGALEELSLAETRVSGNPEAMAVVARLPALRRLGLRGAEVLAETLAGAPVESLDLSAAKLPLDKALPVLEQLPRLRRLVILSSPEEELPARFARLNLEALVVGGERLRAERVVATLSGMPSLRSLSFSNEFEEVRGMRAGSLPEQLGELQQLERLELNQVNVRSLPRQMARLARLRHLHMKEYASEAPRGLLEALHALPGLESLTLSTPHPDQELWPVLRGMKGLRRLNLHLTNLKTVPEWIGELGALEELVLPQTVERLPSELAQLRRLRVVALDGRSRSQLGVPVENLEVLGRLPALEELIIDELGLTRLPRFLEGAPGLRVLSLKENDFSEEGIEALVEFATRLPSLRVLALDMSLPLKPWRADDVRRMGRLSFLDTLSIMQSEEELPERLENLLRGLLPDTNVRSGWTWRQAPGGLRGRTVLDPGLQHP